MNIDPNLPPGNGNGCRPGVAPGPSSIDISPGSGSPDKIFVATGTRVQLNGSAKVRLWHPDCSFVDRNCRSIEWTLFYQPVGGVVTNTTSFLINGPQSNPNLFDAAVPGRFEVVLGCPELILQGLRVAASTIFVGSSLKLDGTATVWIQNSIVGMKKEQNVGFHAVLVETSSSMQVLVQVDPIIISGVTVTQKSVEDGAFDSAIGVLNLHFVGDVSGHVSGFAVSGNTDITLSTEGNITPPDEGPISGRRRGGDGSVILVGDAPITNGPIGTTHVWLQASGILTTV